LDDKVKAYIIFLSIYVSRGIAMADFWRLGIGLFMLAFIIALVEVITKYSEQTAGVILAIGFLGFILCIVGSITGTKRIKDKNIPML